jgi:hypothetical protein
MKIKKIFLIGVPALVLAGGGVFYFVWKKKKKGDSGQVLDESGSIPGGAETFNSIGERPGLKNSTYLYMDKPSKLKKGQKVKVVSDDINGTFKVEYNYKGKMVLINKPLPFPAKGNYGNKEKLEGYVVKV